MSSKTDNTVLFSKSIPKTMPMLPNDPRKARLEMLVTYKGHKQSRGIELAIPPEEIRRLLNRMEDFLLLEAKYYTNKANIDRRMAEI